MRPRLLVIHPSLQPPGGGNGVAVRGVQALVADFRVTLELWEPLRLAEINSYYGTQLSESDFEDIRVAPAAARALLAAAPFPFASAIRGIQCRRARAIANDYDVVITFNNEIDIGRRAIQYTHFPWRYWPRPDADIRWYHRIPGALPLYFASTPRLARFSREGASRNVTLVNSEWTGARYEELYGGEWTTLYPPVLPSRVCLPWQQRSDTFVALGRISREKNLETAIAILDRVRERGHDVELVIAGSRDDVPYVRTIEQLVAPRSSWCRIEHDLSRDAVERLLGASRYGIHAMIDEHFGIAVAEMAMSGAIPFVHRSGGPVEIVRDERLTYRDPEDAAASIDRVLSDSTEQERLRTMLALTTRRFRSEEFAERLRAIAKSVAMRSGSDTMPAS